MDPRNRCGKVNVKVLAILIVVAVALGISLFAARQVQREIFSKTALTQGQAAFENQDWPVAARNLRTYLNRNPDDLEVLRKYAQACLSIRPQDAKAISGAVSAYRRVVQMDPQDQVAYERLTVLYGQIGNYEELSVVARMRLEHAPNDRKAPPWLAEALIRLNRKQEAQQVLLQFLRAIENLPEAHTEYVRACVTLSGVLLAEGTDDAKAKALEWLNRAVDHASESVEALLCRARFYRETSGIPGIEEKDRLELARRGLEAVDARGPDSPQICLFLATEWMAHGAYDRAAAELEACERFPQELSQDRFSGANDWVIAKLLLGTELAMRKGAATEAVAPMDKALASLTEKRHRAQVLPSAVMVYATTGNAVQARQCLDEYLGLLRAQKATPESARRIAGLQALVAGAENRPYAVIDALTPGTGTDASNPQLWRMLADAYGRTDQARRAVHALTQCRRLNPRDPQTTLELARQYSKLSEWRNVLETAATVESQDPSRLEAKVLRLGAAINLAVTQRGGVDTAELQTLSAEITGLRRTQPDSIDIRLLQVIVASYLESPEEVERQLKSAIEECQEPLRAEMHLVGHYLRTKRTKEAITAGAAACQRHPSLAEPWLSLAEVHLANADYDSARACLKQGLNAVQERGERRSLSLRLAFLEVVHGDRTVGINLLKEMAAQDPQEIQARLLLLGIRDIREDPAAADQLIASLRQAEGESGLWWRLHQAARWMASEDWRAKQTEIEGLLRACLDADPAWSAPVLLRADLYGRLGDVQRVQEALQQALAANPSAADVAGRLLALLEKQGRFSEAERILQQVQVRPRTLSAWQVRLALRVGDLSRAIDELKLRASNDAQDADSRIQLAQLVYQQTKDINQALPYLNQAEAIAPDAQLLIAVKTSLLQAEGKAAEARQVLDGYLARHNDFGAYWMRALYLARQGALDPAEQDYRKLTTLAQNREAGYELLSNFYAGTKRLDQGIAALEEGLGVYPQSLGLKRNLMLLLLQRAQAKDRERAAEILTELEGRLPPDAELLTIQAGQMLEQRTPQSLASARAKLETAVRLEPTAVKAHYDLIGIAMRQGQYKAACDYAVRALESNPRNPLLLLARGRAELALGYAPMAVRLAREVLQQDPNSLEAAGLLTNGALRSRDRTLLQESRTTIDAFLGRDPKNERLLISRAYVLTALELPQAGIPELEAYCQTTKGSRSVVALITLADLYRQTGAADQSRQKIEQAQKLDPGSQAVVHGRFLWLVSQNREEELKGISSAYLSARDQQPGLLLGAGSILVASSSADLKKEGLKLLERAVTLLPTSAEARLGWASALYQTGEVQRAEQAYREWLKQHPDDVRALNDLAWILQEHYHRYDAALDLANRGLRLAPDDRNLLDTRGVILTNLPDRLADAKNDFIRLVESSPARTREKARALLRLARLCTQLNDPAGTKQHLQAALDIDREINVFTTVERAEISKLVRQSGT